MPWEGGEIPSPFQNRLQFLQMIPIQVGAPPQVSSSSRDGRWDLVTALLFPAEFLEWRRLEPRPVSGAGSFPLPSGKLLQDTKNTQNISQMLLVRASECCNCHRDVI